MIQSFKLGHVSQYRVEFLSPFFVCSYVATLRVTVLDPLFVDVRLTAPLSILMYLDMDP